jgi:hypothetical protein
MFRRSLTWHQECDFARVLANAVAQAVKERESQVPEHTLDDMWHMTCEAHPWLEWPHESCPGPGMPVSASLRVLKERLRAQIAPPSPKVIQLQPWHDLLLGLTDTGEIYRLTVLYDNDGSYRIICDSIPLFPGFPTGWPPR